MSETKEKEDSGITSLKTEQAPSNLEPEDKWLIRDCYVYKDEYKECTSFRGRFHQYFIFGEPQDCKQWKKDYDNCCKWEDKKDVKAAEAVIQSERSRRMERLRAHYRNDTWKKRDAPPADWDKPLPEWLAKRDENTYLTQKAKEIKEGNIEDAKDGFCSIM
ncbi:synaptic plasticity regulator PANTS isoform X2 [Battus philenor]